jgi:hypothetical protein
MVKKGQYYFGSLLKEIDVFAFPRTGSHFLAYCFAGLFDSVSLLPEVHRTSHEAISRQDEIRAQALYALDLREAGAPFQPVWLNPLIGGVHGIPVQSGNLALLLIRDPIATAFSAWRARHRLGFTLETSKDLNDHLDRYETFYDAGLELAKIPGERILLVRYELLTAEFNTLERIVEFVELKPKLTPQFVHWITKFDNFVNNGERSFYREGDNHAWRKNDAWCRLLQGAGIRDFSRFGY